MFQSIGMRNEDGSAQQCRRTPVTHVDTSHFLSSSSTPVATKTVDVQTVSFSEMAVIRQSSASPKVCKVLYLPRCYIYLGCIYSGISNLRVEKCPPCL